MSDTGSTTGETTTPAPTTITVIGLGNLGQVLARTFLDQGHQVTVWNRSQDKADELVARGATLAASPAEAVAASDLIVVCVLDYTTVRDLLTPTAAALAGRVVVNLTSGTPDPARELGAWVGKQGAAYVDGAVYAIPQTVGTPEAFVLYSGDAEAFARYRTLLETLGSAVFVGTDAGLAPVYDVAVLSGMYGMFAGFFQTVAVGGSAGIEAAKVTELLVRWLTEAIAALPGFAAEIDAGDYRTETSNLDINAVGLAHILAATKEQGVGVDLLAPLHALFERQVSQGHGAESMSRAIESLR
ncbi:NAD(P)-dependent oxidoreductase [Streptomyces flavofungini]|uniref:NAD(P)-dependent oxidoreductase n=1 Tax=Streptomyces flavofungini TaxID=68200 RepID=A0ABS0XFF6_9ACTN|nr:NAD(P)-binding domain-containing protein [Streptomyces flavofungini]MBJ3810333.1 NAD(P)-dependent oxidoreductase [Streptomyces flavofungini]MBJ3811957.1 NAD(P)-dependent oxidoreductase [Streptomyces flavofungini]GHC51016.1 3-hydroxyisobutyrate dehydrogenase [Streptomyces flavofungini]